VSINQNLKYALVLAGGGARGLVHVGALCAMEKAGYPKPALIAGCSMGAIVGGLYASGMSCAELKRFVLEELDLTDFMESPGFKLSGPLGKLIITGQFIGNFASKPGIDSGEKVISLLEKFVKDKKIEDCPIPFLSNAVDIVSGSEVILDSGPLVKAIRASMSYPAFFEPVADGQRSLVDGGIVDNMPITAARERGRALGVTRVLAINTRGAWAPQEAAHFKTGINVVLRCFDILVHDLEKAGPRADLELWASDKSTVLDFDRKKELVALGEAAVEKGAACLGAFFGSGVGAALARRKNKTGGIRMEDYYAPS